ncbi:MAG: ROK family protein [Gemmatimonadota bacterium]|nr:ROK family protein [Gemmatimonadota bacterium]MDP6802450.1 ROK family protein [Gemmatimonadota bacterium]MDP7030994.1 ROK family protein [Gemmatimonadota bacterium]
MSRARVLGFDIGGTNAKAVLADRTGRVLARSRRETSSLGAKGVEVAPALAEWARELTARHGIRPRAVGVACAGLVDARSGRVESSPNLPHLRRLRLGDALAGELGRPVHLENDANALAWAEFRFGAGRGARNLVCLALGTGVGGGLVMDGRLHRGAHGLGAELGHMVVERNGRRCACGQRGCLEAYAGAWAITRSARRALARGAPGSRMLAVRLRGEDPTPAALSRAARDGSALATALFAEAGRALGVAVASLVHIFDPDRVLLAGGVSAAGRLLLDPAREEARSRVMDPTVQKHGLRLRKLGDDGAALGAALLAME